MATLEQQQQQERQAEARQQQSPSPSTASAETGGPPPSVLASGRTSCPQHVLAAIYGSAGAQEKQRQYDKSLHRWWNDYAERKNDDEADEYVADSLLYDKKKLPRTAPAPECVARFEEEEARARAGARGREREGNAGGATAAAAGSGADATETGAVESRLQR